MQSLDPKGMSELFVRGMVSGEADVVRQLLLSTTAPTALSWLQATDRQGNKPLQYAARHGHLAAIQPILSLEFSLKLTLANRQQFAALLLGAARAAAAAGHQALEGLLQQHVQSHADIIAVSKPESNCPILHQAARLGDLPAVQLLLSGGAHDSLTECPAASTAAPSAGSCANTCADAYVLWTDAPTSALEAAIQVGSVPMVGQLLAASTPAQLSGSYGYSALSHALKNFSGDGASTLIVQMLLDAGAAVTDSSRTACVLTTAMQHASLDVANSILAAIQRTRSSTMGASGSDGSSDSSTGLPEAFIQDALCSAVTAGRADMVELLLQLHDPALAEPATASKCLNKALCLAAELEDPAVAQLLLKHGGAAAVNTVHQGCTPLHVAIRESLDGNTAVVKFLLDAGANPSITSDGKTALQLAMQHTLRRACDENSTAPFDCLLSHSSQPLSAAELVSTAWSLAGSEQKRSNMFIRYSQQPAQHAHDHNMPAFVDSSDEGWDTDEEVEDYRAARKHDAQHSMLCGLLRAAAAKDSTAAQAALTACRQELQDLYEDAKSNYDGYEGCTCGCCQPEAVDPDLILRAQVMLRAMSEVWLNSSPVNLAAQRSAVQHMLVSATASLKQLQYLQHQHKAEVAAQAASMAEREAVLAIREQQMDEREQQVVRREAQARAREEALEKKPLAAAAMKRRKRL